jgi:MFS family permease
MRVGSAADAEEVHPVRDLFRPRRGVRTFLLGADQRIQRLCVRRGRGLSVLSTVPVTNGVVAQIFGVRYMAMLSGFTFFSHQIGSFLGAWLGGKVYDMNGNYDLVWYLSIVLAVLAGLINLPIDERAIKRPRAAGGLRQRRVRIVPRSGRPRR